MSALKRVLERTEFNEETLIKARAELAEYEKFPAALEEAMKIGDELQKIIAQLRAELETTKKDLSDSSAQLILDECEIQTRRAELDEAKQIIKNGLILYNNLPFQTLTSYEFARTARAFLSAHPEEK